MLIVPCALTTLGAATLAALASAAPFKNLRRVAAADGDLFGITSSLAYKLRDDVLRHLNPPMISRFQSRASSRRHKPPSKKYRSRSYRFKCKTVFAFECESQAGGQRAPEYSLGRASDREVCEKVRSMPWKTGIRCPFP